MSNPKHALAAPATVVKPADGGKTEVATLSDALIGSASGEEAAPVPPAPAAPLDLGVVGPAAGDHPAPATQTFLTTRHTDRYGPGGRFLDLSAEEAAAGLEPGEAGEGPELTVPTADQLARRRPAP